MSYENLMLYEDNKNLADKFEHSHHLFAGYCRVIIGRRYMFISPGSERIKDHL